MVRQRQQSSSIRNGVVLLRALPNMFGSSWSSRDEAIMMKQLDLFEEVPPVDPLDTAIGLAGLVYLPVFLSPLEQKVILDAVDSEPWRNDLKRRVQHYG